ncbi:LacI family DNA-binding transcriptional regulator [Pseudoroseomonas ludipueritiae]|uniref:LacI family DNA-binding transcriptional regulator n=1 Tax=Pseudoroseomonas ludipueritiae TaxID=198093 RepID=A0ABR7R580_9PROT|nr:LacI family DNA-binding transcriptional regulator [Pseudoroseomonas ludipueritiae]MBC9176834.1 LacI family DNA-binding transcriptional regulator [Pseudoroseomonas ludipueritiae]
MSKGREIFRRVTANDVARLAGTSQSAVSRVFTPGASVSAETREKVMAAAGQLGYRPNAIARSLITRRSRIVAVAMAYLNNQFYPDVLEALSDRLQAHGYQILLFTADRHAAADPVLEQVMRYQVDAIVLASTSLSSAFARECRQAGVPVVMFNRTTDDPGLLSVTGDNERGGHTIARFLLAGGHRRPAFIAGLEASSTNRDRERGFTRGLAEAGLATPLRAVGHYSFEGAAEATRQLLRRANRPDAIFCANDHMAIACMDVARHEFGLSVPEDLSVIGFDDVGPARWAGYDLTSYSQPLLPMVEATVTLLMECMEDPSRPMRGVVLEGQLVVRGSARRPAGWAG